MRFDESKHPRSKDGKFTNGNGNKPEDRNEKLRAAVKKYSDTPTKDMAAMGITKSLNVEEFIDRVKTGQAHKKQICVLSAINPRTKRDIEKLTGEKLNATKHVIDSRAIAHIEKRHGKNGEADHSMSSIKDYQDIEKVLNDYDSIDFLRKDDGSLLRHSGYRNKNNQPSKSLIYTKNINESEMMVVEALTDNAHKEINVVTAYKKRTD